MNRPLRSESSLFACKSAAFPGADVYDAQGNPTSYRGNTLVWEKGRQLRSFGATKYHYDANGIRNYKRVGGTVHTYLVDGAKILEEHWGSRYLCPFYNEEDEVCGFTYETANGRNEYYFQKNLQGDVIALINKNGVVVARYT